MRVLWWFSLVSCAVAVGAGVIICIPGFERLTQLFWSRVAPFGQLACQVLVVTALVRRGAAPLPEEAAPAHEADGPRRSIARRAWAGAAVAVALVVGDRYLRMALPATAVAIACAVGALAMPARLARHAAAALAVIALGAALWASPRGEGMTTVSAGSDGERALYRWARDATPTDALFATPPKLARFRLLARRAIIADTKSPPLHPDALVGWYRRLCALVDQNDAPTHETIEQLWYGLSPDQLERIARGFGADYIVVGPGTLLPGAAVYQNGEFAVYRTQ